jgi:hypothetical protein
MNFAALARVHAEMKKADEPNVAKAFQTAENSAAAPLRRELNDGPAGFGECALSWRSKLLAEVGFDPRHGL